MLPLVLQIIPSLYSGGAERFAIELADRLPAFGFRTKLIVLFENGPLREEVQRRDLRWLQILHSRHGNRMELLRRLRTLVNEEEARRPAIVHTHLFGSDFWVAASQCGLMRRSDRPKFISTAHNIDPDDSPLRRLARRFAATHFDRVISVSDEVKRYTVQKLGVPSKRAMMIDGMCLLQPDSRPAGSFHRPPQLLTVARLEPQKGIETALRALADVPPPWHYTIVGTGALERDLKELAERLGIASRVTFAGVKMNVPELLQSADLFLFPSRWEGLGSAALEAAWAGVPVLTSDIDPLRSVFPAKQRLPIDDAPAWSKAIRSALADPAPLFASAAKLSSTVASRFHPDEITKQYAVLYDELLRSVK